MSYLCETSITRRRMLGTAGALFGWTFMPRFAHAAGSRDPRFVCIILRGALDGLSAVPPVGDPDYAGLRGELALSLSGPTPALSLDGFFALHPSLPTLARLYKAKQATVVHAAATGYRARSHFDGQDVLESGQPGPGHTETGWLNRMVAALPAGEPVSSVGALGIGAVAPLIVRGRAPVIGWAPQVLPEANEVLIQRVSDLYAERDPVLAKAFARGVDTDHIAGLGDTPKREHKSLTVAEKQRAIAEGASRLIGADNGPRIAALALDGWDTHASEGGATGRLAGLLAGLDATLAGFEAGLKNRWSDTVIMIATEFGRTVRTNGTVGTDHGTGTVVFLVGGAMKGGRVIADWPSLSRRALYEDRDLTPTCDVRGIAKGVIADLFGISGAMLARDVFPETDKIRPMSGLVT